MKMELPRLTEIEAAAQRISGVASRTPLIESPALSGRFGITVYLKLKLFKSIHNLKNRGAYNKMSQMSAKENVAASSGNHGIAVAYSSRMLGKQCTVVVPEAAVKEKLDVIQEYGADVVKFGKYHSDREMKAREIASQTGATFIPPFNDRDIIAGQGTCGLEIAQQLDEFDSVIVPVGGGGLISGISIAIKSLKPSARVYGVEPAGAAKMQASLSAGRIVAVKEPKSIADGLVPASVGELTLEACQKNVEGMFSVTDDEILVAMKLLMQEAHIFAEPSGSAPLAVLSKVEKSSKLGGRVVLVISGGNVSLNLLDRLLS